MSSLVCRVFSVNNRSLVELSALSVRLASSISHSSPTNPAEVKTDQIGPPNKISNLRPVVYYVSPRETQLERQFRIESENVQKWNEEFWIKHNSAFLKESNDFRLKKLGALPGSEKTSLSAEEMSEFYKSFLDKNWKAHVAYNFQWYGKNFSLLYLALKVQISKVFKNL